MTLRPARKLPERPKAGGKLYAYGLPMTTEEAVARVVRGDGE